MPFLFILYVYKQPTPWVRYREAGCEQLSVAKLARQLLYNPNHYNGAKTVIFSHEVWANSSVCSLTRGIRET